MMSPCPSLKGPGHGRSNPVECSRRSTVDLPGRQKKVINFTVDLPGSHHRQCLRVDLAL